MRITFVRESAQCPSWEVGITSDAREVIADAVTADHPCGLNGMGSDNTCDIAWALEQGYPLAAAYLLRSAGETPALDAAVAAMEFNGAEVPLCGAEFDEWCASPDSDSIACRGCGARVYTDHDAGCGSCGAELGIDVDAMLTAYVETALWSSTGDDGDTLDGLYTADDLDPDALAEMRSDCKDFARSNIADLDGMDPAQAGHDFWLTRNRHGAGFWYRGLGDLGDRLTTDAHAWGSVDLFVGDDNIIYTS
ncbi:hypothetical protein GCM10023321_72520 [Pseudonocardia eucalypti]|uniref:Antirestriction protein ArdA n=1 Tax=Pseudonocardia eucalypti TaxID=648755 RepID=A0ABP9R7U0_9PSEU|nr:hypothetical protein [Pseudonocardia eucalypti]